MGTVVSITLRARNERAAEQAFEKAFGEIAKIDRLLSHHRQDSELSRLNRDKRIESPSTHLLENIRLSLSYARLASGAFDITVLPILDLYERAFEENRTPTASEIATELERVDYRRVRVDDEGVTIGADQKITLGGIAKGYAVDLAAGALRELGIEDAIVAAGGDLRVMGRKAEERDWQIAIQNPRDPGDFIARVRVPDRAVVTSGDYERYYDAAREYHHIIDPLTGRSATSLISVTIVAPTAFEADVLSTTVFVLGAERGLDLIESLDTIEGLIITQSRRILKSSGWSDYEV